VRDDLGFTYPGEEPSEEGEPRPERHPDPRASGAVNLLAAAMLAVGHVMEPEKTEVAIVAETSSDPFANLPFRLDFGNLPPLE